MAQLTCQRLCVGYEGKSVLQELNFEIFAGSYLCIVGENGSGKSTLMKTILGLQPPISGRILTGDGLRKNEIGYLPQQTVVQKDFPAAVREIVLLGCQGRCGSRPFYSKEEKRLAAAAMDRMQIAQLAKRCYRELSGGQQQRVLLARALCATRKMLLLDEPVSGLDPKVTAEMYALIAELNRNDGITVIMISHDITAAEICQPSSAYWRHRFFRNKSGISQKSAGAAVCRREGGRCPMTAILEKLTLYWTYPFVRYALVVGVLIALCSSLLGVTLVLKRFSFIGDGLSHVAFGAMALPPLQITNEMPLVMVITISSAACFCAQGRTRKSRAIQQSP